MKISKIEKIVYLSFLPLSEYIEKVYYIRELQKSGFSMEYWELSALFSEYEQAHTIKRDYQKAIDNYKDLAVSVRSNDNGVTLYVPADIYNYGTAKLYRRLSALGCLIGRFDRPGFPLYGAVSEKRNYFRALLSVSKYPRYFRALWPAFLLKLGLVNEADIVFAAGEEAVHRNGRSEVLPVNHFDYDGFLEQHEAENGGYCVFLDDYLAGHPDFQFLGVRTVDPRHYYDGMNRFFEKLEKECGMKVIIAGHPKADYTLNLYGGREIIQFRTAELVRRSELVITHASTSLSFAVAYNKPAILVSTDEIREFLSDHTYLVMTNIARELGIPLIDVDEPLTESVLSMDGATGEKYEKYKFNYLTTLQTKGEASYKVIARRLRDV